ncbi:FAD-dependent pyridine nucleotide-disulfide oxidoreductase [Rhodococcus triatomae BKS 15-14]|nr:FAD-dependent pyridine nucleotide-disulfide oxidoreductase [Rhodococcus triatomae BKS 15-14]
MQNIVVVGGSIAAVTAAETLRLEGFDGSITLLSQESVAPYTRVPLSKGALAGRESLEDIFLPSVSGDVDLRTGVRADSLDLNNRVVHTNSGSIVWDGLVIATGARARRLAPELREFVVRDHRDCDELRDELVAASSVLVVGGGFLGMEIASTLRQLDKSVTLIDREPPMQRLVGSIVAARIRDVALEAGILFHVDPGGVELFGEPGSRPLGAKTSCGRVFEADLVISAVGDVPNVEWLAGSGLKLAGGVCVDSRCRVRADVVAAGDVASRFLHSGNELRIPSWTNAVDQSRAAARALLHGDAAPEYVPSHYFWTEQFGLDIKVSGPMAPDSELETDEGWNSGGSSLLTWGPPDAPRRVLGWNHHLRPAQLKRLTRNRSGLLRAT